MLSAPPINAQSKSPTDTIVPLTVSPNETVETFVNYLFPAWEFLIGAELMAFKDTPVVGAFAHDAGVYLVFNSAFDQGDIFAKIASYYGLNSTMSHAASATVLFLAGKWSHKNGDAITPNDYLSVFARSSTTNQISATLKSALATGERSNPAYDWNSALQLALANVGAVIVTGPLMGQELAGTNYLSAIHKNAIITATYRLADLSGAAINAAIGATVPASQFFNTVALASSGWALMNLGGTNAQTLPGKVADSLVEASMFAASAPILAVIASTTQHYLNADYATIAGAAVGTALTAAAFAHAKHYPQHRFLQQADSGVRLGWTIFMAAPLLKSAITKVLSVMNNYYQYARGKNTAQGEL